MGCRAVQVRVTLRKVGRPRVTGAPLTPRLGHGVCAGSGGAVTSAPCLKGRSKAARHATGLDELVAATKQLPAANPLIEDGTSQVRFYNFGESSLDILVIFIQSHEPGRGGQERRCSW